MVVLGLPVLTADYDFWVHSDDVEKLNIAARPFDLEVEFDSLWSRRVSVEIGAAKVFIPSVDDLILTKRIGGRPKDAEDIRLLQRLKEVQE